MAARNITFLIHLCKHYPQNVAMVNTVLASIMAKSFKEFSVQMQAGRSAVEVAQEALNKHWKVIESNTIYNMIFKVGNTYRIFQVIFNGNSYDPEEQAKLIARGVCSISSTVEALQQVT